MCEWEALFFFSKARVEKTSRILEIYRGRMESILERIGNETNDSKGKFENYFIGNRIKRTNEDFDKTLLTICDGNIIEYKELKKSRVEDFLIKLDNCVSKIETLKKK